MGVLPKESSAPGSAPRVTSSLTASMLPPAAAVCSGDFRPSALHGKTEKQNTLNEKCVNRGAISLAIISRHHHDMTHNYI